MPKVVVNVNDDDDVDVVEEGAPKVVPKMAAVAGHRLETEFLTFV